MAGIDEIKRLKGLCEEYALEGREILASHTDEELAGIFNGIGPEAFPQWLRAALDALHPSLAPVAFIHDVEWSESDGSEESFAESNARFRRNGIKVACAAYGWWRPRRYKVMWDAVKFARVCQRFGWSAECTRAVGVGLPERAERVSREAAARGCARPTRLGRKVTPHTTTADTKSVAAIRRQRCRDVCEIPIMAYSQ